MDRRRLLTRLGLAGLAITLVAPLTGEAATKTVVQTAGDFEYGFQGEGTAVLDELDRRPGKVQPNAAKHETVRRLGAAAVWHALGSPRTLYKSVGFLTGPREGTAVEVARAFVQENAGLFGLRPELTTPERLELLADNPLYESPDRRRQLQGHTPLTKASDVAHVVLFRQLFGDGLFAGQNGLLIVGVDAKGRVAHVSSSVTGFDEVQGAWDLTPQQAIVSAAKDVKWDIAAADLRLLDVVDRVGFATFTLPGTKDLQRVRRVVMPIPGKGVRLSYEVLLSDSVTDGLDKLGHKNDMVEAYTSYVDAQDGNVWVRNNDVDHFGGGINAYNVRGQVPVPDPQWTAFGNTPPLAEVGVPAEDIRSTWCWVGDGCDYNTGHNAGLRDSASPYAYDEVPPGATDEAGAPIPAGPTLTSQGNNAWTTASYFSHLTPDSPLTSTPDPLRQYAYPFEDQWHAKNNGCNLSANYAVGATNPNDRDASILNLFFGHNRMHDWAYFLGFTESTWNLQQVNFGEDHPDSAQAKAGDPEKGQAQAGAVAGSVVFTGRDNANQITQADGVPGVTNQYLWHPLQAGFYSPCVDGAYDQTVIAHEYTHATTNRMIAGPDQGISGNEGGSMGESWGDLSAIEYNLGYGLTPVGDENPFAVGPYATGSKEAGIRSYGFNRSPLNYSNLGFDGNGATSPHADGEIWSATQYSVRQALVEKYDALGFNSEDTELQYRCADGLELSDDCPGNRRWIQMLYDAFLLQDAGATMAEAAAANIAADKLRYDEENAKEMWTAYASRGMGAGSAESGSISFTTPAELDEKPATAVKEATVRFQATAVGTGGVPESTRVFVGRYEARASEAAISEKGALSAPLEIVAGTYDFLAQAEGYGHLRFTMTLAPGETKVVALPMRRNHASLLHGGEADGDGGNFEEVIDDTEETNWAFLGENAADTAVDKQFTVALAGGRQLVEELQISTANRPEESSNPYDDIAQSRFAALQKFEILTCDTTTGAACEDEEEFTSIYISGDSGTPEDAFPAGRPRPTAPNLQIKAFDVPATNATHVRLKVLANQCIGNPIYSGAENPVGEPLSNPDCVTGFTAAKLTAADPEGDPNDTVNNTQAHRVRVSELQVFSTAAPVVGGAVAPPAPITPPVAPPAPVTPPAPLPATGADPVPFVAGALLLGTAVVILRRRREADGL